MMETANLGLSTKEALKRLHSVLKACLEEKYGINHENRGAEFLRRCIECFGHSDRRNLVCLNFLFLQSFVWIAMIFEIFLVAGGGGLIVATIVFGILVISNALICFRLHELRRSEMRRKALNTIEELENMINKITKREGFDGWNYADPFSPNSESITQQWALRDTVEIRN